jgi:hypothetical protein
MTDRVGGAKFYPASRVRRRFDFAMGTSIAAKVFVWFVLVWERERELVIVRLVIFPWGVANSFDYLAIVKRETSVEPVLN